MGISGHPEFKKSPFFRSCKCKGFIIKQVYLYLIKFSYEPTIASRDHPRRIKSYLDGILQGGDLLHQCGGEKKEAGVGHVPEVAVGVEAKAEVQVLITRQGRRHLILNDWERKLLNQREKEEGLQRGKRIPKGEEHLYLVAVCWYMYMCLDLRGCHLGESQSHFL